jgi:single-strand DNA-binding protein
MNNVVLQGNLASDPVSKDVTFGNKSTKVVRFTVAASENYKKADGTFGEDTQFVDCEAWDAGAVSIAKNWKKGDPVLVSGKIKKEVWEKDGQKHSRQTVRVSNFKKFARYQKTEETVTEPQQEEVGVQGGGEEIPF